MKGFILTEDIMREEIQTAHIQLLFSTDLWRKGRSFSY